MTAIINYNVISPAALSSLVTEKYSEQAFCYWKEIDKEKYQFNILGIINRSQIYKILSTYTNEIIFI